MPDILYKYRCFDSRAISMLSNNQIYFSNPLDFNDPFDCLAQENRFINLDENSVEEFGKFFYNIPPEDFTPEKNQQLIAEFKKLPEIQKRNQQQNSHLITFIQNLGVLALSERNDSILMWAHYANNHTGFCIGFKNNLVLDHDKLIKVRYTQERYKPIFFEWLGLQVDKERFLDKAEEELVCTKYSDWQYEEEWRLVSSADKGLRTYSENVIDRIVFGLRMAPGDRSTIKNICKDKNVSFFEAVKSPDNFSVEIQEIE